MPPSGTHPSLSSVRKIVLPDLVSHCTFKLRVNRHRKQVTTETKKWLFRDGNLLGKKREAYHGLKAGLLTSMCYPDSGYYQLRVVNDFMTYLFHLDNLSDDMDNRGTRTTADEVLNSLYHPHTWQSSARVGKMTREYVSLLFLLMAHLNWYIRPEVTIRGLFSLGLPVVNNVSSRRLIFSSKAWPNKLWIVQLE